AIPRDAVGHRCGERAHARAVRPGELGGAGTRPGGGFGQCLDTRLETVELALLLRDLRALDHEVRPEAGRDEHARADPDEDRRAGRADCLLMVIAREKIDGAHQSSIPSPIATASEPSCSGCPSFFDTFMRASGSPTRTCTPISFSSSDARPGRCVVPPVSTISPMPRDPGWFW